MLGGADCIDQSWGRCDMNRQMCLFPVTRVCSGNVWCRIEIPDAQRFTHEVCSQLCTEIWQSFITRRGVNTHYKHEVAIVHSWLLFSIFLQNTTVIPVHNSDSKPWAFCPRWKMLVWTFPWNFQDILTFVKTSNLHKNSQDLNMFIMFIKLWWRKVKCCEFVLARLWQ